MNKPETQPEPLPPATGSADGPDFISELRDLINRRSMENASNTPDFILAQYLTNCLRAWNQATQQRETWYGRDARPTSPPNTGTERRLAAQEQTATESDTSRPLQ
jgi:hypothetical protein